METNSMPEVRQYAPEDLETENFRIDSATWKERKDRNGTLYLTNPEGDVTEILEGPHAGEQHFRNDVAVERELAKADKRTMTPEEWSSFVERHSDWMKKSFPLPGVRSYPSDSYDFRGACGYYWCFSPASPCCASFLIVSNALVIMVTSSFRKYGFSIRCLKN